MLDNLGEDWYGEDEVGEHNLGLFLENAAVGMMILMMTLMMLRNRKRRQGGGQPAIFIEGGLLSCHHCNSDDGHKSGDNDDRPKASTPASGSVRPR